jgi:hypothetical protein
MSEKRPASPARQAFLRTVRSLWPIAKGSLALVRKPCIRANCRACQEGRKHPAFIFSFFQDGRRHCRYVPRDLVPVLRRAIANGRKLERLILKLGEKTIQEHRRKREKS